MGIYENYINEKAAVEECCEECGRNPHDVFLLAVSKTVGLDGVRMAIDAGCTDFGENRPDQLLEKYAAFPNVNWHFIGNIQSRRIKDIVACATLIHSLFQEKHAQKIDEEARAAGKVQDVLIEVNVSGEESKSGISPDKVKDFLHYCLGLQNVRVRGLMTMAPAGDTRAADSAFSGLQELLCTLRAGLEGESLQAFTELSMGMSGDWRQAVPHGSTIVRIGRAIFSEDFVE